MWIVDTHALYAARSVGAILPNVCEQSAQSQGKGRIPWSLIKRSMNSVVFLSYAFAVALN